MIATKVKITTPSLKQTFSHPSQKFNRKREVQVPLLVPIIVLQVFYQPCAAHSTTSNASMTKIRVLGKIMTT